MYVIIHFLLALGTYQDVFDNKMTLSQFNILGMTGYVLFTLTSMGFLIDQRPRAAVLEMLRCVVMVTMQRYGYMKPLLPTLAVTTQAFVSLSLLYWALQSFSQMFSIRKKTD
ncbi:alkylglycerol monooxygenase-like [Trematomus bernacchii]|uniref:alkylglycerol monooxygenase-like n=1 Tax=Trematomus bernacchii TaxID=40690 RepID=UPI00146ECD1C|nr:alkylglycerol monooxygenase-like [Trematomus bernacchii]